MTTNDDIDDVSTPDTPEGSLVIRPRSASVIGVVWIYLGSSWVLIGAFGVLGYLWLNSALAQLSAHRGMVAEDVGFPLFFLLFPASFCALGAVGLWSALGVLRLRVTAVARLRWMNWVVVALIVWFGYNWVGMVTRPASYYGSYVTVEQVKMALLGVVTLGLTCVPFLMMAHKLKRLFSELAISQL